MPPRTELALADVQCFETEALMAQAGVVAPVLTYLFHRLEERFDGRPTLLILDEAWIFLDHPLFAARIREWLKVLRKKNVAVVFATQIARRHRRQQRSRRRSSKAARSASCCPTTGRSSRKSRAAYERFGLNERQIELIARADAQAALLSAVPPRQSAVRARARPDRARALRRVRPGRSSAHRPRPRRAWRRAISPRASLTRAASTGPPTLLADFPAPQPEGVTP